MSEFKRVIQDTNGLLQGAKNLTTPPSELVAPGQNVLQPRLDAVIKAIEELANHLREKESLQQTVRGELYLQMERVQEKMLRAINQLEATPGRTPEHVSRVRKARRQGLIALGNNERAAGEGLSVGEYLTQKNLPISVREVTDELTRLEFVTIPVTHDHALGSCTGTLKFNGYLIAFLPTSGSKDGFRQALSELKKHEFSDKLGLHFRGKTYRFDASRVEGKDEGHQKMKEAFESLSKSIEK